MQTKGTAIRFVYGSHYNQNESECEISTNSNLKIS